MNLPGMRLLPHGRAKIWLVALDAFAAANPPGTLSAEELRRAQALVDPLQRLHHVAAHRALRMLLSHATGLPQHALAFGQGAYGKPLLLVPNAPGFNMSHCHNRALIAIAEASPGQNAPELGLDLESWREIPDAQAMAQHVCTPQEAARLQALHAAERLSNRSFLDLWTRKEACVKALGCGLQVEPASFEVGHAPVALRVDMQHGQRRAAVQLESIDLSDDRLSAAIAFLQ